MYQIDLVSAERRWKVQYELYIDVFILVNFMMDYMILAVTDKILHCHSSGKRRCLGALIGAVLTCAVLLIPVPYAFVKFILFHGFVNIVMIKTGLKVAWGRSFFQAYVVLYISGFLLGGVFEFFQPYIRTGSLFFAFAVVSYYMALGIWKLLSYLNRLQEFRYRAVLVKGEQKIEVTAILDTGNQLHDPVTGAAVNVLCKTVAKELWDQEETEGVRWIPYHSVGKEEGVMMLRRLDMIMLLKKENIILEHPYVAISEEKVSDGKYDLILNPDLL